MALEVLSEMSNYFIYRRGLGNIAGILPSLLQLTHSIHLVHRTSTTQTLEDHKRVRNGLVDRLANFMANLLLDGLKAIVRPDGQSFLIIDNPKDYYNSQMQSLGSVFARHVRTISFLFVYSYIIK